MLFSHISDTHLGFSQYGTDERENDFYQSFSQMIDISVRDHVDFVILSGDLFHVPNPSGDALLQMANGLKKLKQSGIEPFFVLGEHDISRIRSSPVPWIYHNLGYATYVGDGKIREFKGVSITGFDKIRRNEIEDYAEEFRELGEKIKTHEGHKILVMHQGISEFNKFAGDLGANDLPKNFSYYAMGHLHDHYVRSFDFLKGPVAYPGSIELTSNEGVKDTKKGFFEVDISGDEAVTDWIAVDSRPHMSIKAKFPELADKIQEISTKILEYQRKPVVELRIQGEGVKLEQVQAQISRLNNLTIRNSWKVEARPEPELAMLTERPNSIEGELFRLSVDTLGSEANARFAIKELMPMLSAKQVSEATQAIIEGYKDFRKERKK